MRAVLRSIVAVLAGFVAAFSVIAILEAFSSTMFYPLPDGLDPLDREAVVAHYAQHPVPLGALVVTLVAYVLGSVAGGALAALLGWRAPLVHAVAVGTILELAGILNLQELPHPFWFTIATLLVFYPSTLLAAAAVRASLRPTSSNGTLA